MTFKKLSLLHTNFVTELFNSTKSSSSSSPDSSSAPSGMAEDVIGLINAGVEMRGGKRGTFVGGDVGEFVVGLLDSMLNEVSVMRQGGAADGAIFYSEIRQHLEGRQLLIMEMVMATELLKIISKPEVKAEIEQHLKKLQTDTEKMNRSDTAQLTSTLPKFSASHVMIQQYKARQQLISEIQGRTAILGTPSSETRNRN